MAMRVTLLVALSLLVSWPVLIHGAPDFSDDGLDHARDAKHFATQLWQGDWYPRWFTNVNGGLGGPAGFFYPPLASYASSLFWPFVAVRDPEGWLAAGLSIVLAQILSGISAYLWLRSITKPGAALLGAAVYVIAPYHLAVDVYQRGASAELWVFVWFPLVLLSAERLIRHSKWALCGAALSYALAILSHPTVSLCFAPIPVAYVLCFSIRKEKIRAAALMTAALLVGVALDAVYLAPAMLDQNKAYVEHYRIGNYDYRNQWLWQDGHELARMGRDLYRAVTGTMQPVSWEAFRKTELLLVTLSTLAVVAALFLVIRWYESVSRLRDIAVFYAGVAILSFFLMTNASRVVWRLVPFLKFLQFPFRLNVILVVSLAALVAAATTHGIHPRARGVMLALSVVLVAWLGLDIFSFTRAFSVWRTITYRMERNRYVLRTQLDERWPKPGNLKAFASFSAFDRFLALHPPKAVGLQAYYGRPIGTARIESWQPRRVVLKIDAPTDSKLTLNHFYCEGWRARSDEAGAAFTVTPSQEGLIQVDVPPGKYDLIVELPRDKAERWGVLISLTALVLLVGVALWAGSEACT